MSIWVAIYIANGQNWVDYSIEKRGGMSGISPEPIPRNKNGSLHDFIFIPF
jgi:hypothetical protein